MFTELPLSIKHLFTVIFSIIGVMTRASLCGWRMVWKFYCTHQCTNYCSIRNVSNKVDPTSKLNIHVKFLWWRIIGNQIIGVVSSNVLLGGVGVLLSWEAKNRSVNITPLFSTSMRITVATRVLIELGLSYIKWIPWEATRRISLWIGKQRVSIWCQPITNEPTSSPFPLHLFSSFSCKYLTTTVSGISYS